MNVGGVDNTCSDKIERNNPGMPVIRGHVYNNNKQHLKEIFPAGV